MHQSPQKTPATALEKDVSYPNYILLEIHKEETNFIKPPNGEISKTDGNKPFYEISKKAYLSGC
jgi:hypothetical protein